MDMLEYMDDLTKALGEPRESNSETLPLCVTPTVSFKFKRLMEALEGRGLKRQGLARIKSVLEREIDEISRVAGIDQSA